MKILTPFIFKRKINLFLFYIRIRYKKLLIKRLDINLADLVTFVILFSSYCI